MTIYQISPSSLQLYADCPRCWQLSKQRGKFAPSQAMNFGTRVHSAIHAYHRDGDVTFTDDVQPYLDEYMQEYDREYNLAEEYWKVPLFDTGIDLSVKLDLIKDDCLIEHKTSSKPYTQEFVDAHMQVTAYVYAWSQIYDEHPKNIRMNVFITNPKPEQKLLQILETTRDAIDIEAWRTGTLRILDGIANDEFEPRPTRWHNYKDCPLYVDREGV